MATTIYVGPNDKKLGLRQHQIFIEDHPLHVQAALKANPGLANLFMSFDEFVKRTPPGTPVPSTEVAKSPERQGPPIKNLKY
jgi:hypothetical protein